MTAKKTTPKTSAKAKNKKAFPARKAGSSSQIRQTKNKSKKIKNKKLATTSVPKSDYSNSISKKTSATKRHKKTAKAKTTQRQNARKTALKPKAKKTGNPKILASANTAKSKNGTNKKKDLKSLLMPASFDAVKFNREMAEKIVLNGEIMLQKFEKFLERLEQKITKKL